MGAAGEKRDGERQRKRKAVGLSPHHEMAGVLCAATRSPSPSPSAEPNGMWRLVPAQRGPIYWPQPLRVSQRAVVPTLLVL
ncbi:hypothetical protein NQZ68_012031 [Dissostichus eleginoides]|nr:hypothetical protein NQZ68_012031 [Dissostichus eleginoides]